MPPSAFLRELSAAGLTLTPEPRARLRFTLLGRTLTFTAWPWSVRLDRAEPQIVVCATPVGPAPTFMRMVMDEPADDIIADLAAIAKNAAQSPVPLVADGPCIKKARACSGLPDAQEWGFLAPYTTCERCAAAYVGGYADTLHHLNEAVAWFAAALVQHHLAPSLASASAVRAYGRAAAGQIVAIMRRVTA